MTPDKELTPGQKYKMEQVLYGMKKNKKNFVKKYGMKAEALMRKRALKIAKNHTPEPTSEEMKDNRLKKLVQDVLSTPLSEKKKPSFTSKYDDEFTDKRKNLPDNLQKAILKRVDEDMDLGHEDNEPHMIKAELAKIGKYAMELYKMVDQFEGEQEVDFPAWWQSKITTAKNMISSAKHYLDFELNEPQIDAMVGVASEEEAIDEGKLNKKEEKIVKGLKKSGQFKKDDPQMYAIAKKLAEVVLTKLKESKGEYAQIEKEIADLKLKGKNAGDKEIQKLIKRRAELEKSKK
jgi:hypothetical protein